MSEPEYKCNQYSPKLAFSSLISRLLTHYRPLYCKVVSLTVQYTLLRFFSSGCALYYLPGLTLCRPTLAKMPGILSELLANPAVDRGMGGPGDSRLMAGQPTRAPELCSLFRLRFHYWGCSRFGGVSLPRPEGHAHLGAIHGKHRNTFQGQGRTDKSPAWDNTHCPSRARPGSPATSGSAQTPGAPFPRLAVSRRALRRKGRVDNNKPHGARDPALTSSQSLGPRTRVPARSRGAGAAAAPDSHPSGPSGLAGCSAAGRRRLCRLAAPQGRLVAAAEARAAAEDGAGHRRLCCCRGRRRRCRVSAAPVPIWRRACPGR